MLLCSYVLEFHIQKWHNRMVFLWQCDQMQTVNKHWWVQNIKGSKTNLLHLIKRKKKRPFKKVLSQYREQRTERVPTRFVWLMPSALTSSTSRIPPPICLWGYEGRKKRRSWELMGGKVPGAIFGKDTGGSFICSFNIQLLYWGF